MQLNPYLTYTGACEEAFRFYADVLGGKIVAMMHYKDTPASEHVPADWRGKVIHARMVAGDSVLMGCDAPPGRQEPMKGMSVTLNVAEPAEAERVFHALAEGADVGMPMAETFWAKRFGMLVDRFGTPWMVNCEKAPM